MNTHKLILAIILIIAFTILIFTVSNKRRKDITESFKLKKKLKKLKKASRFVKKASRFVRKLPQRPPEPEEIQQSIKDALEKVVQEVVEEAEQQDVDSDGLKKIQTAANNVVSGAMGGINKEDIEILNEQINLTKFRRNMEEEMADLKEKLSQQQQNDQEQTNEAITELRQKNASLEKKWKNAQDVAQRA